MVSVTERVKTLFFSPLQPRNAGGRGGEGGPHLCGTSPASHQETFFQNDEKKWWFGQAPGGPGPQDPGGPGPKPLGARGPTANLLLAPLDFLCAVPPPKNIVPVIVTSEDSASRVTSITVRSPPEAVRLRSLLGLRRRVGLRWQRQRRTAAKHPGLGVGTPIGLALQVCSTLSVFHTRGPGPGTARASVNARTHLPVTTAASSRRASVSQVWPVGRRTEPEAL